MSKPFKFIKEMINDAILEDNKKKYYVGKLVLDTVNVNPSAYLGFGTWELWGAGRVPVGVDTEQAEFNAVEKTGGEKTHKLTVNEMPVHSHNIELVSGGELGINGIADRSARMCYSTNMDSNNFYTSSTGGGSSHNNLQPYITCYIWKRVK